MKIIVLEMAVTIIIITKTISIMIKNNNFIVHIIKENNKVSNNQKITIATINKITTNCYNTNQ